MRKAKTKEEIIKLSKKYKTIKDFKETHHGLYDRACSEGWLCELTWLERAKRGRKKGVKTKEEITELTKKLGTLKDFKETYPEYYKKARTEGWLGDLVWLKRLRRETRTKGEIIDLSKSFTTIKEFYETYPGYYQKACVEGWVSELTWLERLKNAVTKTDIDTKFRRAFLEAKKCSSWGEFYTKSGKDYHWIYRQGLGDYFLWLGTRQEKSRSKINKDTELLDTVYIYEFVDGAVYIGRTMNLSKRDKDHRSEVRRDTVFKYAEKKGIPIPEVVVLESGLSIKSGASREKYWIEKYQADKVPVINQYKGGGLGRVSREIKNASDTKISKQNCYELAKKCKTSAEYRTKFFEACETAIKNGWHKEYTWLRLTKRERYIERAKKYKNVDKFRCKDNIAFKYLRNKGIDINEIYK